jgi:benzoylformate decarboxylase
MTPSSTTPTVRTAVLDLLRAFGIRRIFGNPGSTELPLFLDFPDDFEYVLGLQESIVVAMADGHAAATRKPAFVNLHSAAGVGHAMGAIFTAWKNRSPMILTAGQQARSILPFDPFLFSAQATELPKPYVKWAIEPARAEDVPLAIARACYLAMQPPCGPVLVSIPADDWSHPCEPVPPRTVGTAPRPDPAVLAKIGEALDACERPAFVVGAGVDRDGAWEPVLALAERHRARVFTAPMSARCGFPEDHPQFAGFLPAMREHIVAMLQGTDLVLALGAPAFTYHVEGQGPHLPAGASLYQLIDDPDTAAWTPVGTSAVGSVRLAVQELLQRSSPRRARPMPPGRAAPARAQPSSPMSAAFALQTLAELRAPSHIVVEEAPSARPVMQARLPTRRTETFYTMASGGLGWAMGAAVGVALGKPGERIIGLVGDGSAMYAIQALWTAAHLQLPITYVVLNNGRYAALEEFAPVFGFARHATLPGVDLRGLDFVALARGQGVKRASRVEQPGELRDALGSALRSDGPSLVEIIIS